MKNLPTYEAHLNEASGDLPKEVEKILNDLVKLGMKKYQLSTRKDYGVWMIELPYSAMPLQMLSKISELVKGSVGMYGSGSLTIKTEISVR